MGESGLAASSKLPLFQKQVPAGLLTLTWLFACLGLFLGVFSTPGEMVGVGWASLVAKGAAIGALIGFPVTFLTRRLRTGQNIRTKLSLVVGPILFGMLGGSGAAFLLNNLQQSRPTQNFELPIIDQEWRKPRRSWRSGVIFSIRTISPGPAALEGSLVVKPAFWDAATSGRCIRARLHTGRFGAAWLNELKAVDCSLKRGRPADRVIVDETGWRWVRSASLSRDAVGRWTDPAVAPGTECRLDAPDAPVMRCRRL